MPNVVKGSRQHAMRVVPYRPWRRILLTTVTSVLVLVAIAFAYYAGFSSSSRRFEDTFQENLQLLSSTQRTELELEKLRSRLTIAEQNSRVDRQAIEAAQTTIASLRQRLSRQEQDLELYRQVLATEGQETGLVILPPEIRSGTAPQHYGYRLVFRQQGVEDKMLEAVANVTLSGQLAGESQQIVIYGAKGGSETGQQTNNLSFKYFQVLEGEFELPEAFEPELIQVDLILAGGDNKKVSETFSWASAGGQ
ncbi:MAG: hypothetical protein RQ757_12350 [Pseudomonadales bacterium]|nr:hypothetical protein [Pseudomonadales bacterium]